jgi:hypothetical protein
MPDKSKKKLRVLCLHGFRTNVQVMQDQTRALREALGDAAEFVFLNATYEATGPSDVTIETRYAESKPFYEWIRIRMFDGSYFEEDDTVATAKQRATDAPHGKEWGLLYLGMDETLEYMDEQLRAHGPFDVVVGFSQGAVLLTVLTMWYLQHQNVTWWKLAVCVGGVRVSGANCQPLFVDEQGREMLVPLPSVHVVGKTDSLYDEGLKLADMWADHPEGSALPKLVLEHDGGHKFPSGSRDKQLYRELVAAIHKHCAVDTGGERQGSPSQTSKL